MKPGRLQHLAARLSAAMDMMLPITALKTAAQLETTGADSYRFGCNMSRRLLPAAPRPPTRSSCCRRIAAATVLRGRVSSCTPKHARKKYTDTRYGRRGAADFPEISRVKGFAPLRTPNPVPTSSKFVKKKQKGCRLQRRFMPRPNPGFEEIERATRSATPWPMYVMYV